MTELPAAQVPRSTTWKHDRPASGWSVTKTNTSAGQWRFALDPSDVGGIEGKGAFARALVERCRHDDALLALTDALILSKPNASPKVRAIFEADAGEEIKPGANIGGYRVQKKIGEGGIGVVYLAEQKDEAGNATRVAVKVVRPAHARDRAALRRYQAALRLLKRIETRARAQGLQSIFVLTTRTMHWFIKRGFVQVNPDWLPEARKRKYNWDRRSQVLVKKLG